MHIWQWSHSGQPGSRAPIWKKEVVCFADGIDLNFWGLLVRKKKKKKLKKGGQKKERGEGDLSSGTQGEKLHIPQLPKLRNAFSSFWRPHNTSSCQTAFLDSCRQRKIPFTVTNTSHCKGPSQLAATIAHYVETSSSVCTRKPLVHSSIDISQKAMLYLSEHTLSHRWLVSKPFAIKSIIAVRDDIFTAWSSPAFIDILIVKTLFLWVSVQLIITTSNQ